MPNFTPGPWHVNKINAATVNAAGGVVASCGTFIDAPTKPEILARHKQALANARLIAAAPDLLAALRAAVNHLEGDGFCCDDIIEAGNAAIEKAEGKP